MQKTVDYYLFLLSPWSYLGSPHFNRLIDQHNLNVNYKPIDVMQTFDKMGGTPPAKRHPSRQRLRLDELKRWSQFLNRPINLHPAHWPTDQSLAAKMVIAADGQANTGRFVDAILAAVWHQERDIADPDTLLSLAEHCNLDGPGLIETARSAELDARYQAITDAAHAADVFGSPTFVYQRENYWGQDRLDFLDRALSG